MNQPASRETITYPAAELDRRFYAFAIDRLVAWSLYAGASYAAYRFLIEPGDTEAGLAVIAGAVVLVSSVFAVVLGLAGVSPGKALVGLRVVRHDDGRSIGLGAALLRTLILGVAALPTVGLGVATLAWTAVMDPGGWRRGWHDHVSKAAVVDIRPVPEAEEIEEDRPRQIVNLTAMRLMPQPPPPPVVTPARTPRPTAPPSMPPSAAPPAPPPMTASVPTPPPSAPAPALAPAFTPTPAPVATQRRQIGPPPPVDAPVTETSCRWRVTFDTGETFVVEGLALVGRRPEPRQEEPVRHMIALRSTDMSLSKTHAQFQVVPDGALVVMDRGSTNGSMVIRKGISKALAAGRPTTLVEGDIVRFGDRTMTVARADS